MAVIVTRAGKGSPLTNNEVDANFINLNTELGLKASAGANSDITSLAGITGGISTADFVQFDSAITPTTGVGKLQWDPTEGGLQVGMLGGNVNLQIGQETVIYVYNNTGASLSDGQVVYCTGSQGQRLTVALAQANSDSTSAAIIGVVTEPIANNTSGFITVQGTVHGLNTSGFTDGAVIYLSPTTAGAWTTTKPVAPQHMVMVGYVIKGGSAGAGSIYVHSQNGYELEELHNVLITSPTNLQFLQYDSATSLWKNQTYDPFPSQTGNAGKFLTTNGTTTSWSVAGASITDDTTTNTNYYPVWANATTGSMTTAYVSSTKMTFNPSTGLLSATGFSGSWSGSTIPTAKGGTNLTSFTANGVVYASSTSALATSSALTFDGTNLGLGTATPTTPDGTNADNPLNGIVQTIYGSSPAINLTASSGSGWSLVNFGRTGGTTNPYRAVLGYDQTNDVLVASARNALVFKTGVDVDSATEYMRITGVGGLAFNGSTNYGSSGQFLKSNGNAPPTWATVSASPAGSTTQVQYNSGGAFAGSANMVFDGTNLTVAGNVTGNSDETLKTNWRDLPADFVDRLAEVKHGTYDRLDVVLTQDGVSAQSLQAVLANSVLRGEDGKLSVSYGNAALVSAIQLAKRLVSLEATVAKLVD